MQRLHGFIKYSPLLKELVMRDIKVRYRHSVLGMLWTVLNPLLMMIILASVFSNILKSDIENYPVYILIGQIVFNSNADATSQGMNAVVWNAALIKKVYIPKYLFPLSMVLSSLINFGFAFIALIIVMIFTGAPFHITMLTVWIPIAYLLVFSFGLSLILCAANVFFRDMQHLYSVFITAWMYFSAIFYSVDIIPQEFVGVFQWNPMYRYVSFFRQIILEGTFPSVQTNLICLAISLVSLVCGLVFFAKTQDKFILHI